MIVREMTWTNEVRTAVDERITTFFDEKRARLHRMSKGSEHLTGAVAELTMRGGKRTRPAVMYAGLVAVRESARVTDMVDAGAAIELLQTYLLIHDDWMDQDDERRGGPSAHVALTKVLGDAQLGASIAILAGDLASSWAWELLSRAPFQDVRAALAVFSAMHEEVVTGQELDLVGERDVALVHHLKTGSYTVRGPLALGAELGHASEVQQRTLERFGAPLGVAFQLRDDLLGTFGDASATGKSTGGDLRRGKRTALVALAEQTIPKDARAPLDRVLGKADASPEAIEEVRALLVASGVRAAVEKRLEDLAGQARSELAEGRAVLSPRGVDMLYSVVEALTRRDR